MGEGENASIFSCFHNVCKRLLFTVVSFLPGEQIFDSFEFKALADDKINVTQKFKIFFGWVENILVRGENAVYQHFLLFPKCFQEPSSSRVIKSRDCVVKS